ncbi:uncharacterized protein LOC134156864 [Pezoporus occidentalis]|uniref:uncharacterized protein LOC134156864 n=1 Tax=Pezoporus occidentalis TaxID=407982 RepID=UPI002F91756E
MGEALLPRAHPREFLPYGKGIPLEPASEEMEVPAPFPHPCSLPASLPPSRIPAPFPHPCPLPASLPPSRIPAPFPHPCSLPSIPPPIPAPPIPAPFPHPSSIPFLDPLKPDSVQHKVIPSLEGGIPGLLLPLSTTFPLSQAPCLEWGAQIRPPPHY